MLGDSGEDVKVSSKETMDLIRAYYQLGERPRRRLLDLAKSGSLVLGGVKMLVLDEADRRRESNLDPGAQEGGERQRQPLGPEGVSPRAPNHQRGGPADQTLDGLAQFNSVQTLKIPAN